MAGFAAFANPTAPTPLNQTSPDYSVKYGEALPLVCTENLGFVNIKANARLKLLPFAWNTDLPSPTQSSLAIASRKSLLVAAGPDCVIVDTTDAVRSAISSPDSSSYSAPTKIPKQATQVAFTNDESQLLIAAADGSGLSVYDSATLLAGSEPQPSAIISLNGATLRTLAPNPTTPNHVAAITSDGNLLLVDLVSKTLSAPRGDVCYAKNVSFVTWSNKGKQMVAGKSDGTAVQIGPDGLEKAQLPRPANLEGDQHVSSISWIANDVFVIAYTPNAIPAESDDIPQTTYYLLSRRPQQQEMEFRTFPEPLSPYGLRRCPASQFVCRLRNYDPNLTELLITASSTSLDLGIQTLASKPLASDAPENIFTTTFVDESLVLTCPLIDDKDTSPIGFALDLSSKEGIPFPDNKSQYTESPLPAIALLTNTGHLLYYYIFNKDAATANVPYRELNVAAKEASPASTTNTASTLSSAPLQQPSAKPAFGAPSFGMSGFAKPASETPSFGNLGLGTPTFAQPVNDKPAFGQPAFGQPARFGQTGPNRTTFGQAGFGKPAPNTPGGLFAGGFGGAKPVFGGEKEKETLGQPTPKPDTESKSEQKPAAIFEKEKEKEPSLASITEQTANAGISDQNKDDTQASTKQPFGQPAFGAPSFGPSAFGKTGSEVPAFAQMKFGTSPFAKPENDKLAFGSTGFGKPSSNAPGGLFGGGLGGGKPVFGGEKEKEAPEQPTAKPETESKSEQEPSAVSKNEKEKAPESSLADISDQTSKFGISDQNKDETKAPSQQLSAQPAFGAPSSGQFSFGKPSTETPSNNIFAAKLPPSKAVDEKPAFGQAGLGQAGLETDKPGGLFGGGLGQGTIKGNPFFKSENKEDTPAQQESRASRPKAESKEEPEPEAEEESEGSQEESEDEEESEEEEEEEGEEESSVIATEPEPPSADIGKPTVKFEISERTNPEARAPPKKTKQPKPKPVIENPIMKQVGRMADDIDSIIHSLSGNMMNIDNFMKQQEPSPELDDEFLGRLLTNDVTLLDEDIGLGDLDNVDSGIEYLKTDLKNFHRQDDGTGLQKMAGEVHQLLGVDVMTLRGQCGDLRNLLDNHFDPNGTELSPDFASTRQELNTLFADVTLKLAKLEKMTTRVALLQERRQREGMLEENGDGKKGSSTSSPLPGGNTNNHALPASSLDRLSSVIEEVSRAIRPKAVEVDDLGGQLEGLGLGDKPPSSANAPAGLRAEAYANIEPKLENIPDVYRTLAFEGKYGKVSMKNADMEAEGKRLKGRVQSRKKIATHLKAALQDRLITP